MVVTGSAELLKAILLDVVAATNVFTDSSERVMHVSRKSLTTVREEVAPTLLSLITKGYPPYGVIKNILTSIPGQSPHFQEGDDRSTTRAYALGAKIDWNDFLIISEMLRTETDNDQGANDEFSDQDAWYVLVGHRFGKFLPYVNYTKFNTFNGDDWKTGNPIS